MMQRQLMLDGVKDALVRQQQLRSTDPNWVENERMAVALAVNEWAKFYGLPTITVDDVERIEHRAMGHVDYTAKLALYACELSWGDR